MLPSLGNYRAFTGFKYSEVLVCQQRPLTFPRWIGETLLDEKVWEQGRSDIDSQYVKHAENVAGLIYYPHHESQCGTTLQNALLNARNVFADLI